MANQKQISYIIHLQKKVKNYPKKLHKSPVLLSKREANEYIDSLLELIRIQGG
ncbi:hypothetical protein RNT89_12835 [Staphylococcus pseudintermedius]|uniref:hypothetical protein n=1 Tax=Staphylococcus TaxID=1279 RepID=UPI000A88D28F|nr:MULTISPECIES: hypothetical protein [Staphylococcus]EGQ0302319.1 hypothetical protein [Staphylococcus pseudintermedius]EGQ2764816.1 hypothetical protein [Staphylococcus pseudintermedius]EGQ3137881.1 hypothetical protein [Staphylococcus pseudintermedius]EGQ3375396.1 hypothetical protein [Staphylococcus pseudintermedius]EGQ3614623.1 hypothetical protein [Staphylococcus pseudintermedius]